MKLSMRILTAVIVLVMAGWATGQTELNQVKDVKIGRVMKIREVGELQNPIELKEVDGQQDKTVQLYRAADEVVSVSVKSGPDKTVYTLILSNGDEKKIPVEQLAGSSLVRGIKNLEELEEFDDLRIFAELKMTSGLRIIGTDSQQEKAVQVMGIAKPLQVRTNKTKEGQEVVEVFIFGKDSEERSFAVGCTVRPDQIRTQKVQAEQKDKIIVTDPQGRTMILQQADEKGKIIVTGAEGRRMVLQQAEEKDRKVIQLQTAKEAADQQAKQVLYQMDKLRAELDKLDKTDRQKERRAAIENEIMQLEVVIAQMKEKIAAQEQKVRQEIMSIENALVERVQQMQKESGSAKKLLEQITASRLERYEKEITVLKAQLAEAHAKGDEEKAREIQVLLEQLRQKQTQEEAKKEQALDKYLVELDKLQSSLVIKKAAEAQRAEQSLLDRVRALQEQSAAAKAYQEASRRTGERVTQQTPARPRAVSSAPPRRTQPQTATRARREAASEVLVIPVEGPMTAEQLGTTVENMEIMRRIFERKLEQADLIDKGSSPSWAVESYIMSGLSPSRTGTKGPQSMYLQGYGALFFLNVDYPLVGPEEKVAQAEPKPAPDKLWNEVKKELKTPPRRLVTDQSLLSGTFGLKTYDIEDIAVKEYDEEKVEKLKDTLLETLIHAGNMSHLGRDELIVIHVTGANRPLTIVAETEVDVEKDIPEEKVMQVARSGTQRGGAGVAVNRPRPPQRIGLQPAQSLELVPEPAEAGEPTHLVIRARKSDIDAWAKQEMSFEVFTEEAIIFIY